MVRLFFTTILNLSGLKATEASGMMLNHQPEFNGGFPAKHPKKICEQSELWVESLSPDSKNILSTDFRPPMDSNGRLRTRCEGSFHKVFSSKNQWGTTKTYMDFAHGFAEHPWSCIHRSCG